MQPTITKLRLAIVMAAAILLTACNEEDPFSLPYDMTTQNMMDSNHGGTPMAGTDVRINADHNFVTSDHYICDYGQVLDLGHLEEADPDITTVTNQAAVQPNEGYLVFHRRFAHRFPSGCMGIAINGLYYRLWVSDWINDPNNKKLRIGAVVNYAQYAPRRLALPEWDSDLATINLTAGETEAMVVVAHKGVEVEVDEPSRKLLQAWNAGETRKSSTIKIEVLNSPNSLGTHTLWLRCKNSFTRVNVVVK